MILTPNQPGAVLSPATAYFLSRYCNLSALRVKAMNPNLDPRISLELLDLRKVALMYEEPALPTASGSDATSAEADRGSSQWLSPQRVADRLGITDRAVRLACTTGACQGQRVGGRWRISPQAFEDYKSTRKGL